MTEEQKAIIHRAIAHVTISAKSVERMAGNKDYSETTYQWCINQAAQDHQLIKDLESLLTP
ncbi:hypothetical protein GZ77_20630 [Endozoicomonas montiporae]|uniref:Uncharacterized protein n=2 Tax=Endozoicomonas montiporae TaxID=1027273 RepID=A0A081N327_9GAMM|nr:hypothetical protein [Endozoicomonas montiporae]AMO58143.1 hypothetical protein EZMO1_4220 [Endozoicomonas montiporae CL-33]KEQ12850.1 hypothetical protein GZ77_20630 [Endozoicomonas montiporae]